MSTDAIPEPAGCHIMSCADPGTERVTAICRLGHFLDTLYCIIHADDQGRALRAGELHCGQCWDEFQGEILLAEVATWAA